jgi:hypothetical protein
VYITAGVIGAMNLLPPEVARDRYLRLMPLGHLVDAQPQVLRYADTVRRASDWRTLAFTVNVNEYGNPERSEALAYRFFVASERDHDVKEAIATGKRAVIHPLPVYEYFRLGCALSEFVSLPADVPLYCRARSHFERGELLEALPLLEQACSVNPDEVRYREILFPLRLALGDLKAIPEELTYFHGDIDSMVHTGRVKEWLRLLKESGDLAARANVIVEVEAAFAALCSGQSALRRYGAQRLDWYQRSHDQFRQLAAASSNQKLKRRSGAGQTKK